MDEQRSSTGQARQFMNRPAANVTTDRIEKPAAAEKEKIGTALANYAEFT